MSRLVALLAIGRATPMRTLALRVPGVVLGGYALGVASVRDPTLLHGLTASVVWGGAIALFLYRDVQRHGESWTAMYCSIALRLFMALAYTVLVLIFYGGSADYVQYQAIAREVGESLVAGTPSLESRAVNRLLAAVFGAFYLLCGPSLVGMFVLSAMLGCAGSYLFYRAFQVRAEWGSRDQKFVMIMMLFGLPGFVMWTSVLGKESLMLFGLGVTTYSYAMVLTRPRLRYAAGVVAGVAGVMIVRPAIGVIVFFGLVGSLLFHRPASRTPAILLRPVVFLLLVSVGVGAGVKLIEVAIADKLKEEVVDRSVAGALVEYHEGLAGDAPTSEVGLGVQIQERSMTAVIAYLPTGMFALLFRPAIVEARRPLAVAAALESTLLLWLVVRRFRRLLGGLGRVPRDPFLAYCWISFLLVAAVVSIGPNLGVLVRQRSMVVPFLILLLAGPSMSPRQRAQAAEH